MAAQTTSSIVIDAPAADVMDVIADFDAYPEWAKGVTKADVISEYDGGLADNALAGELEDPHEVLRIPRRGTRRASSAP